MKIGDFIIITDTVKCRLSKNCPEERESLSGHIKGIHSLYTIFYNVLQEKRLSIALRKSDIFLVTIHKFFPGIDDHYLDACHMDFIQFSQYVRHLRIRHWA